MKPIAAATLLFSALAVCADPATPAGLEKEASSLREADVAWRGIPWKSCLLEGLAEAKQTGKPAILWVFIDRPVNDERC
ncbi:MAG: hypothetical protein FD180_645 [Planctomycetota bacterium]|nr:MAG: hypothetical protein FD180_645 [Planctomycetota bacterium]